MCLYEKVNIIVGANWYYYGNRSLCGIKILNKTKMKQKYQKGDFYGNKW